MIYQAATWPGVGAVESCTGTVSHGISPAAFVMTTYPQAAAPQPFGDLTITDGLNRAVFRDCKLDALSGRSGGDGQTFVLTILDRRWKWRYGAISGRYNVLDPRGKLVPWTIRSPQELAELCLAAMGERNYRVHLPEGLTSKVNEKIQRFLELGETFPQSFTNPLTVWDMTPPAEALARLAELYGCRVIYQPFLDRVLVAPLGAGRPLPPGPCEVIAPSVDSPETPSAVGVAGVPVRIQMRLLLEPVGKEWDGSYRPVNELSYAPQAGAGKVQITTATYTGGVPAPSVKVYLYWNTGWELPAPPSEDERGVSFQYNAGGASAADKLTAAAAGINAHPLASPLMSATAVGNVLTVTGKIAGFQFRVVAETSLPGGGDFPVALVQSARKPGGNWEECPPPTFGGVRATDRLSYDQAIQFAQSSVFRCYRVLNADAETGKFPIRVPWVGPIKRRHQLVLQPTKVDQVVPEPRDPAAIRLGPNVALPIRAAVGGGLPEFFNGVSRDQGADVFGSVTKEIGNVMWLGDPARANTDPEDKVYLAPEIDPAEQVVTFPDYVYLQAPVAGTLFQVKFPVLTLETAVLVTEEKTGEVLRWKETLALGGNCAGRVADPRRRAGVREGRVRPEEQIPRVQPRRSVRGPQARPLLPRRRGLAVPAHGRGDAAVHRDLAHRAGRPRPAGDVLRRRGRGGHDGQHQLRAQPGRPLVPGPAPRREPAAQQSGRGGEPDGTAVLRVLHRRPGVRRAVGRSEMSATKADWVPVYNGSGEMIPSCALARVTAVSSAGVVAVDKPDTDDDGCVIVLGFTIVPSAGTGQGTFDPRVVVAYEEADGTPAAGEEWGAAAGSWKLRSGKTGFRILGGAGAGLVNAVRLGAPGPAYTSPLTTKGDVFTFTTVDARLPVGANGYLLSADSTEPTGLKWVAPGSADTCTGCGWASALRTAHCLKATVLSGSGACGCEDANDDIYLTSGDGLTWTDAAVLTVCETDYTLAFTKGGCDGPCLTLTGEGSDAPVYTATRDCCGPNYAIFSFGDPDLCTDAEDADAGPAGNVLRVRVEWTCCPINGWAGEGPYCVRAAGSSGACTAVILLDENKCDDTIEICSGPYPDLPTAEAACAAATCCPDKTRPLIFEVISTTGDCDCFDGLEIEVPFVPDNPLVPLGAGSWTTGATSIEPCDYPFGVSVTCDPDTFDYTVVLTGDDGTFSVTTCSPFDAEATTTLTAVPSDPDPVNCTGTVTFRIRQL